MGSWRLLNRNKTEYQRIEHIPLQYLDGKKGFARLRHALLDSLFRFSQKELRGLTYFFSITHTLQMNGKLRKTITRQIALTIKLSMMEGSWATITPGVSEGGVHSVIFTPTRDSESGKIRLPTK